MYGLVFGLQSIPQKGSARQGSVNFCSVISVLLTLVFIVGCAKPEDQRVGGAPLNPAKSEVSEADQYKSEDLANEGEILLAQYSFDTAYSKFAEAVQIWPENNKAIFWRAVMKPMLEIKGILRRVAPLYKNPKYTSPGRYDVLLRRIRNAHPQMKRHLLLGPEDIHTPEELQEWLERYAATVDELRGELKKLLETETTVRFPNWLISIPLLSDFKKDCEPISFGPISFDADECLLNKNMSEIALAKADIQMLLAIVGYHQVVADLLTAYSLNIIADSKTKDVDKKAEAEEYFRFLTAVRNNGRLRKNNPFPHARPLAEEVVAGLKYVLENQDEVCRYGHHTPENRPGFLFSSGFCTVNLDSQVADSESQRTIRAFEMFLAGEPVEVLLEKEKSVFMRFDRLVDQPISDLNAFGPFSFNECGHLIVGSYEPISYLFESRDSFETFVNSQNKQRSDCNKETP